MAKDQQGVPFGKGRFGALDGWADDVATRVKWRQQEDQRKQEQKGGKR